MTARKAKAAQSGRLLELCIEMLPLVGFVPFPNKRHFEKAKMTPARYFIRNWPHPSLYDSSGRKEALLVADICRSRRLMSDEDGRYRCILEAKYQSGAGSVDEKMPYVYEACLSSPISNWLIVCGGDWWKHGRGEKAVIWLQKRAEIARQRNKRLVVFRQIQEFRDFLHGAWGNQG